jgi:biopolymer transport protein ExbD
MRNSRRIRRMERVNKGVAAKLNLTSLMDVFTILVLYLLVNQSAVEVIEPPKQIKLPDSVVQAKPRQTVVVMVNNEQVLIQGKPVMSFPDLLKSKEVSIAPIKDALIKLKKNVIGVSTRTVASSNEVTIMAHRTVPFKALKTLMSSCASAGYNRISLAVIEKASQT